MPGRYGGNIGRKDRTRVSFRPLYGLQAADKQPDYEEGRRDSQRE